MIADREGLRMTDHHSDDGPSVGHPGVDERANAGLGEKDLIARTAVRRMGVLGKTTFVRTPSKFGRSGAFLVEAFNRPGVDEFVDILGPRRHLSVALRDVDHFGTGRLAESSEG